jgi:hypothetical protein
LGSDVSGLDDSVISFEGPGGVKKTKAKRYIGGLDYMNDIDNNGDIIGGGKREVRIK